MVSGVMAKKMRCCLCNVESGTRLVKGSESCVCVSVVRERYVCDGAAFGEYVKCWSVSRCG